MINHLCILLVGFSVFSLLILMIAYVFYLPDMRKNIMAKAACVVLISSLILLQLAHYIYFTDSVSLLSYRTYTTQLTIVPAAFFFFGRVVLFPDVEYRPVDTLHLILPVTGLVLPISAVPAVAFLFGTAYTFWFAHRLFKLRDQRKRFKFEMFFFGLFALMALIALFVGLSLPYMDSSVFYITYSNVISIALVLVVAALLFFPQLLSDILLITELAYTKSKLTGIDVDAKVVKLETLMSVEKHYQNEDLSLTTLAEHLELTPHQLSELVNTQYNCSFPRYVRECRIKEAKRLLISESTNSILSIRLMKGFKSQSNFYTAFKEVTGESPGNYRKKQT